LAGGGAGTAERPRTTHRVLMPYDENDPVAKRQFSTFTQALADLVGPVAATCGWTFGGPAVTSIGYERSRGNWSACNRTSSWQSQPPRPPRYSVRRGRSRSTVSSRRHGENAREDNDDVEHEFPLLLPVEYPYTMKRLIICYAFVSNRIGLAGHNHHLKNLHWFSLF
jgi:hypothetical protein